MGVKVAVVGGGSTYTPELVEGFVTRGDRLPVDELTLLDIDPERLAVVGALAQRMMRRVGWSGTLRLTDDRDEALEGADFVIVQLRVGGQASAVPGRDDPADVRLHRAGDDRPGRVREGACGRFRWSWSWRRRPPGAERPAPGSSTSRTRPDW